MRSKALSGLCVVTDPEMIPVERFEQVLRRALIGGARIVRYRDGGGDWGRRFHQAVALRDICIAHDAIVLIDNDVRLAAESGAHGLHLTGNDASVDAAREMLGYDHIVGADCLNSLPRARRVVDEGADYVLFGSFFPSHSNPGVARADLTLLGEAKNEFMVPIAVTGGITLDNADKLIAAGADIIAVSEAVFGPHDPEQAAHHLTRLFSEPPQRSVERVS